MGATLWLREENVKGGGGGKMEIIKGLATEATEAAAANQERIERSEGSSGARGPLHTYLLAEEAP